MDAPPEPVGGEDFDSGASSFDFESPEGEENGGSPGAPGAGQSKSSRRRRRKRRNKVTPEGSAPAAQETPASVPGTIVMEGESLALAASAAPSPSSSAGQTPGQAQRKGNPNGSPQQGSFAPGASQQNQGAAGTGKRWKKKFRDRERRPGRSDNPGNDVRPDSVANSGYNNGNGQGGGYTEGASYGRSSRPDNFGNRDGFKRKGKTGGSKERSFVGPMDHSYREGNGFAEGPPATIQVHGSHGARRGGHRHQGDSQPLDFSGPRPIPIPEDAQTHIYLFIEDLFLTAKIQETSRKQGIKVAFVKNEKEAVAGLTSGDEANRPALIVFDLNNANAKPLTLIPKLKAKLKRSVSIVGFLSHLQGDLKAKAVEAGCDVVMPRAAFSQNLPNLLRRYGSEEEEEINFNY